MEARDNDISCVPRIVVVEKLTSVKAELKKLTENHYSVMVCLQCTQSKLEWVSRESKEKNDLTETLLERPKRRNVAEGGRGEGRGKWRNAGGTNLVCKNAFMASQGLYTIG